MRSFCAAIGTDGNRAVVWGFGMTEAAARAEAIQKDATMADALQYAWVDYARFKRVGRGDVDAEDLIEAVGNGWRVRREYREPDGTLQRASKADLSEMLDRIERIGCDDFGFKLFAISKELLRRLHKESALAENIINLVHSFKENA